jgi:hypothetical protein
MEVVRAKCIDLVKVVVPGHSCRLAQHTPHPPVGRTASGRQSPGRPLRRLFSQTGTTRERGLESEGLA